MKIGDTYVSNKTQFRVIGFDYEGRCVVTRMGLYVAPSTDTEIPNTDVKTPEKKQEEITDTNVDFENISLKELQTLCKNKNLAIRGTKAELIKRLQG